LGVRNGPYISDGYYGAFYWGIRWQIFPKTQKGGVILQRIRVEYSINGGHVIPASMLINGEEVSHDWVEAWVVEPKTEGDIGDAISVSKALPKVAKILKDEDGIKPFEIKDDPLQLIARNGANPLDLEANDQFYTVACGRAPRTLDEGISRKSNGWLVMSGEPAFIEGLDAKDLERAGFKQGNLGVKPGNKKTGAGGLWSYSLDTPQKVEDFFKTSPGSKMAENKAAWVKRYVLDWWDTNAADKGKTHTLFSMDYSRILNQAKELKLEGVPKRFK
jgi:hypothetical protein